MPRLNHLAGPTAATAAVVQVIGTFGAAHNQPDRRPIDAVALALVLVGPAALAFLPRAPLAVLATAVAALATYIGLGYPYGPVFLSAAVALFAAVQLADRRRTGLVTGLGFAAFVAADAHHDHGPGWLHIALGVGWIGLILAGAELVRGRRGRLRLAAEEAGREQRRQADELRLRVAQELHDALAHNISLINVQASVALHLLDDRPDQARPALANIKAASHDALGELRTALDVLRRTGADGPPGTNGAGGPAAPTAPTPRLRDLDELVAGVRASGLDVHLRQDGRPRPPLPAPVELTAYRIVQEALTNVTRHAQARTVWVAVRYEEGLDLEIRDDGTGGPTGAVAGTAGPAGTGMGIAGMRERAASVGGTVEAGPVAGGGFRVAAHLPGPPA